MNIEEETKRYINIDEYIEESKMCFVNYTVWMMDINPCLCSAL